VAKKRISNTDLIWIIREKLSAFSDCPGSIKMAIIPSDAGWAVVIAHRDRNTYPGCVKRIEQIQKQLRDVYALAED
jgi:hypothetical protein